MKTKHLLIALSLSLSVVFVNAQTKPPQSPFTQKVLDAYGKRDIAGLEKAVAGLEKTHPKHPYTLFFKAYIKDANGVDENEVMRDYSEVIRIAPDLSDPYVYRGQHFHHKGIYQKAIDDFTKAIELEKANKPEMYVEFYRMRGDSYSQMGNASAAFDDFKSAATLFPSESRYARGVANMSVDAKREMEALSFLQQLVNGSQSKNAEMSDVLAGLLLKLQKFSEADNLYNKMFSTPGWSFDAETYNRAGIAAERLENFSKAKSMIEKAIQLDPKRVEFYGNRASIGVAEQNWEDVYTWAKKALEVDSNNALANMYMAVGVKRTGRGDALAAEYEKKAYELDKQQKQ